MSPLYRLITAFGLLFSMSATTAVFAVEIMPWQRLPLAIPLLVGQERVVFLDKNVRVGMDSSLSGKLRVQSAAGALYLLPTEEIPPTRLHVQVVDTGEIILLDVATVTGKKALEPVRVVDEAGMQIAKTEQEDKAQAKKEAQSLRIPEPIALTRYAAQNLYAPLRTVEPLPGISRVPLRLSGNLSSLLPTRPVQSKALAVWRLGNYFVTAVRLTNKGLTRFELDPRELQGDFYAATFQHGWLGPVGHAEDTTVVYLVTHNSGLEKHLLPIAGDEPVKGAKGKQKGKTRQGGTS